MTLPSFGGLLLRLLLVALPPVRVLTKPAALDSLRAALDAALHASAAARGLSEQRRDRAHEDWKRELSDSGLRYNDLLGRPLIHVGRNRVGGHEVESWKPDGRGWAGSGAETVLGPDEDVAAAVAALVGAPAAAARALIDPAWFHPHGRWRKNAAGVSVKSPAGSSRWRIGGSCACRAGRPGPRATRLGGVR